MNSIVTNPSTAYVARVGAVAAILGSVTLLVATLLHPMNADPNQPVAAFTEYAADRLWIASRFGAFLGMALIGAALLALGRTFSGEAKLEPWITLGAAGVVATVALAAVLQAVDGVAPKIMVDQWAASPLEQKDAIFHVAYGVRQVEIGLACFSRLLFGVTILCYGIAIVSTTSYPPWLGAIALFGGLGMIAAGIIQAYSGFSDLAMGWGMSSEAALLLWLVVMGIQMWKIAVRDGPLEAPGSGQ